MQSQHRLDRKAPGRFLDALSSIVLRYPFTELISDEIGFTNGYRGIFGDNEHNITAGINYAFGGRKEYCQAAISRCDGRRRFHNAPPAPSTT